MRANERGMALGIVIFSAIVFSVASFAVLNVAMSRAQTSTFQEGRVRARYAAEAGLVWARERLWADPGFPNFCIPGGFSLPFDSDGNGVIDAPYDFVIITATDCSPTRSPRTLQAKVTF